MRIAVHPIGADAGSARESGGVAAQGRNKDQSATRAWAGSSSCCMTIVDGLRLREVTKPVALVYFSCSCLTDGRGRGLFS